MAQALILVGVLAGIMLIVNFTIWKRAGARQARESLPAFRKEVEQYLGMSVIDFAGAQPAGTQGRQAASAWRSGLALVASRVFGARRSPRAAESEDSDWFALADSESHLHIITLDLFPAEGRAEVERELIRLPHGGLTVTTGPGVATIRVEIMPSDGPVLAFELPRDPVGQGQRFADYLAKTYTGSGATEPTDRDRPGIQMLEAARELLSNREQPATADSGAQTQFTPPLPVPWPGRGNREVMVYAYRTRFDHETLRDGVLVSPPYARVMVDPRGENPPRLEQLTAEPGEETPQGIRPLTPSERDIKDRRQDTVGRLLGMLAAEPTPGLEPIMAEYYGLWRSTNGVIAKRVRHQHEDFFEALDLLETLPAVGKETNP